MPPNTTEVPELLEPRLVAVRPDLCLAFVNTLAWRGRPRPSEGLNDFGALLAWLAQQACVTPRPAAAERWMRDRPAEAQKLLAEAIGLREAMHAILVALSLGQKARTADLAVLNGALAAAPPRRWLARRLDGYAWKVERASLSIPQLLAPVLWSAADLLVAGDCERIRRCANSDCRWLFRDDSKNGSRRWCAMASCGNRAKARRHYLRRIAP
jgi:predicted RNA-binding Zn ribbon-like protein